MKFPLARIPARLAAALSILLTTFVAAGCRDGAAGSAWMASEALRGTEEDLAARCGDGLDNDVDGLYDCDDPDCARAFRCVARGPEPLGEDPARCFDNVDNDENGYTDCRDFSCLKGLWCRTETEEPEDTIDACTDGLDNDWDDAIDCEDTDCMTLAGVDICEASDASCSDGVDNDSDGFVDCGDWSCSKPTAGITITVCD